MRDLIRTFSFAFFALGVAAPFVTGGIVARQSQAYSSTFGEAPEGIGLFASIATGTLLTLAFFVAAAGCALRSFYGLPTPRPWGRGIEAAALCIPPLAVVLFFLFGLLGMGSSPPEVIQTR